jgi:hypothetical protein
MAIRNATVVIGDRESALQVFSNSKDKRISWLTASVLAWLLVISSATADQPREIPGKPQDLTGLSLETLLEEEITPINVLGSHTHPKGTFMIGYRYMYMDMSHNLEGTREVSQAEVLSRYPVVHTRMTMEMHMAEIMYAPSDRITVMAMVPYSDLSMDHLTDTGTHFTDRSSGIGDVGFMGLFNFLGDALCRDYCLFFNAGFTAPTGSIDEGVPGRHFEYAMQLGSGTWNLEPGLTYLGGTKNLAWGAQVLGTIHLGKNDRGYRLGDGYRLSAWTQLKVTDWFGPSARLDWHAWSDIHGADPTLNPARNPAFDPTKQAGERLDFLGGLNFYVPKGLFKRTRFSIEGGVPVYQNIAGPNMAVDWMLTAGISYTFR